MGSIKTRPLQDDLSFGARVTGVTHENLKDEAVRAEIKEIFETRGMVVFEEMEPSSRMLVSLSGVFGPLKDHPVKVVPQVNHDMMPGVIEMKTDRDTTAIVEIDGKRLMSWLPWHFDHCYNGELNRAGVLRAVEIAPEGGLTGFADGIALYNAVSPELRSKIESKRVIYTLDLLYQNMRFGLPKNFKVIRGGPEDILEQARAMPRAIHPAVWKRKTGEKVMHVSPWMSVGIEGQENPEGDALLEAVCQEVVAKVVPYYHRWKPTEMLIWDNWRMLHCVSGTDPKFDRCMHRTTIKGDYGLGNFENNAKGHAVNEMMV